MSLPDRLYVTFIRRDKSASSLFSFSFFLSPAQRCINLSRSSRSLFNPPSRTGMCLAVPSNLSCSTLRKVHLEHQVPSELKRNRKIKTVGPVFHLDPPRQIKKKKKERNRVRIFEQRLLISIFKPRDSQPRSNVP